MPAASTDAAADLPAAKSATGVTGVTTTELGEEPSLLPGLGSAVSETLEAMFVKMPLDGAISVTLKFVVAPPGNNTADQIMILLLTI